MTKPLVLTVSEWVYLCVRCGLAHGYTLYPGVVLTRGNRPYLSYRPNRKDRLVLNVERFHEDFDRAFRDYKDRLRRDATLAANFETFFDSVNQ